ncbi:saccharopine dehydrogenase family protein [Kiloniella antarctica]|uniref:Saccharopine dehydrogenase NADP-binding domain-containing protein n=1 Tax=Kiloniella antarctica TaxID=1550907 RepID=A0ABW5BJQ0_9PROT
MQRSVLILGGYGNFGKRIAKALTADGICVIITGRNKAKAENFCQELPKGLTNSACFDVTENLEAQLKKLKPVVVINTCGPFQNSNYSVAEICIDQNVSYIDLSDGRDFVTGINTLHDKATAKGIAVISGASTVPGLSSAVIDHFKDDFSEIKSITYGISPGQKAERGLATTQAIMSYVGQKFRTVKGDNTERFGWQDIYRQKYPKLGSRWMANCDIPDLDLLPEYYGIKRVRFSAGLELSAMHLGLWGLSWVIRLGLPVKLQNHAHWLLKVSNWFNALGTSDGGMHIILKGKDQAGKTLTKKWFIIALKGDGPQIPTIPAIILAKKIAHNQSNLIGAMPCVGLVSLEEYLHELTPYNIKTYKEET